MQWLLLSLLLVVSNSKAQSSRQIRNFHQFLLTVKLMNLIVKTQTRIKPCLGFVVLGPIKTKQYKNYTQYNDRITLGQFIKYSIRCAYYHKIASDSASAKLAPVPALSAQRLSLLTCLALIQHLRSSCPLPLTALLLAQHQHLHSFACACIGACVCACACTCACSCAFAAHNAALLHALSSVLQGWILVNYPFRDNMLVAFALAFLPFALAGALCLRD